MNLHSIAVASAVVGVILLIIAAYLKFKKSFSPTSITGGVSAFAKIADADLKQKEAEGKIIAVKAAAAVKQNVAADLKQAAVDAHGELDKAHSTLDEVHAILG